MQALERNGYSHQQVLAALLAPSRTWDFAYELLDRKNTHKRWLDEVLEGGVKHSVIEDVRRSAFFRMRETDLIDWSSDRLKPWVRLQMPDGGWARWPQGVFLITAPSKTITGASATRDVQGLDQTVLLRDYATPNRYAVLAGTNYATAIRSLLVGAGVPMVNVDPTDLTVQVSRDWGPGTSRLQIVNDLLKAINYEPISFNSDGVAIGRAYATPDTRAAEYTYSDDGSSVTLVEMTEGFDLDEIPNQWTLVVSDPERALSSQWTNDNPNSPTSVSARGRVISVFDDSVDAPSQEVLDDMVRRRAFEDSQASLEVEFSTGIMPFHDNEDVLALDLSSLGASSKYREVMWDLALAAGSPMSHRAERVVNVDPTNVIEEP